MGSPPGEVVAIAEETKARVNERIRAPQVRVIGEDGSQIGVMATADALRMAREQELDLVEVAPMARPPVCRIIDYGRYQYEQSKRLRKARQKAHQTQLKEVKMSPKIEENDFKTKVRHAREFLEARDKVKFVVRFRGREIVHMEFGEALLRRAGEELQDIAVVESSPRREGRLLTLVLSPKHSG
jgi:translation initiation factor IF-3